VVIEAAAFAGVGRVQRQRMVYAALAEELAGPVHALSVKALARGKAERRRALAPAAHPTMSSRPERSEEPGFPRRSQGLTGNYPFDIVVAGGSVWVKERSDARQRFQQPDLPRRDQGS
jgi:hypothetical protein